MRVIVDGPAVRNVGAGATIDALPPLFKEGTFQSLDVVVVSSGAVATAGEAVGTMDAAGVGDGAAATTGAGVGTGVDLGTVG